MNSSSSSSVGGAQSPGLKTYFKTPEGKYKLQYEKTHPAGLLHYSHGKSVSQLTIACLKEKAANPSPTTPTTPSSSGVVRSAAARLLGGGNGSRGLSFVGGNGVSKAVSGNGKIGGSFGSSNGFSGSSVVANYDGKGTYLIFNVGDTLFISDLKSHDKDLGKKLVGAQHYNKDGAINNSRCSCIAWVPNGDGTFVVGHADGNLYVYEKGKDGTVDSSFPAVKDQNQFTITHARSSKSNPIARWHVCQGSINNISFSAVGTHLATVGRDGYLRVFDYSKEQLVCGGKSYYGALLCCAWSSDGKYILTGGEDDLVQVWSMEDRKIVAWGEGHNSWVSGVAFDSYWSAPNSDGSGESIMYRFGSVGQDTQLLLWDLAMDEIVVPLRCVPPGGSPTFSSGSPSAHWDDISPVGTLHPAPSMRDVPKLSPVLAHRAHVEPLSGLVFTGESVVTICREGHIKIWARPGHSESIQCNSADVVTNAVTMKDRFVPTSFKAGATTYKPPASALIRN